MKKALLLSLILVVTAVFQLFIFCDHTTAKNTPLTPEEEIKKIEEKIDLLTKKIHASSLFSGDDIKDLVEIRTYLNSVADTNLRNPVYPKLFFDAAYVFKAREFRQDAIQFYRIVNDNFPNTIYSKRALNELKSLGMEKEQEE